MKCPQDVLGCEDFQRELERHGYSETRAHPTPPNAQLYSKTVLTSREGICRIYVVGFDGLVSWSPAMEQPQAIETAVDAFERRRRFLEGRPFYAEDYLRKYQRRAIQSLVDQHRHDSIRRIAPY